LQEGGNVSNSVPVIEIQVDDSQFSAFLEKFSQYKEAVKDAPAIWRDVGTASNEASGAVGALAGEAAKFGDALGNPQIKRTLSGFQQIAMASAKSWKEINESINKSAKGMSLLGRLSLQFGAGAGLAGLAGIGAAGVVYGAVSQAAGGVANDYKGSKNLGLQLGQEKAFNTYFDTFGLGTSDLETSANNKGDISKYAPYAAAGVSLNEFRNDDSEQLTYTMARKVGGHVADWMKDDPDTALLRAHSMGWNQLYSDSQLRNLAHDPDAIDKSQDDYNDNWQKMGVSEKAAKDATQFSQHQEGNWQEIKTAWDAAVLKLAPAMDKWSDAATKFTVKTLGVVGDQAATLANDVASDEPLGPTPPEKHKQWDIDEGFRTFGYNLRNGFSSSKTGIENYARDKTNSLEAAYDKHAFHTPADAPPPLAPGVAIPDQDRDAHQVDTDQLHGFKSGTTKTIEWLESKNHADAQGPITKTGERAKGAFQFMDGTAKDNGLKNPFDESKAMDTFGIEMARLRKEFGGDSSKAAAAYNWGEGKLAKLLDNHPDDWKQFLPNETKTYVQGFEKGTGAGGGEKETFAKQMNALPKPTLEVEKSNESSTSTRSDAARPLLPTHFVMPAVNINLNTPPGSNIYQTNAMGQ
jgi:hypothetical protein